MIEGVRQHLTQFLCKEALPVVVDTLITRMVDRPAALPRTLLRYRIKSQRKYGLAQDILDANHGSWRSVGRGFIWGVSRGSFDPSCPDPRAGVVSSGSSVEAARRIRILRVAGR